MRPAVRTVPLLLVLALVFLTERPAAAQRLAYVVYGLTSSRYAILDLGTGATAPASADEAQTGAVFTADGEYAVRSAGLGAITLRHMPSGAQATLPLTFVPAFAHPRRAMIFGTAGFEVARLDVRGLVRWAPCGVTDRVVPMDLSMDGGELYVVCPSGELVVLDPETGSEVRRRSLAGPGGLSSFVVGPDGGEIVATRGLEIVRIDTATGATVQTRPTLGGTYAFFGVSSTPPRTHLIEMQCRLSGPALACSPAVTEFATLSRVHPLPDGPPFSGSIDVTPDGRQAFISHGPLFPFLSSAYRVDLVSGATLDAVTMPADWAIAVDYRPVPLPAQGLAAQVSGETVALEWRLAAHSPAATGYRLVIGSRTGASDIGSIRVGPTESFTAAGVPSWRYFVRLHTGNHTGESPASAELVVDVP